MFTNNSHISFLHPSGALFCNLCLVKIQVAFEVLANYGRLMLFSMNTIRLFKTRIIPKTTQNGGQVWFRDTSKQITYDILNIWSAILQLIILLQYKSVVFDTFSHHFRPSCTFVFLANNKATGNRQIEIYRNVMFYIFLRTFYSTVLNHLNNTKTYIAMKI